MIVLVDIDHTICDAAWRDGMIGTCSWDEYHQASVKDKVIQATRTVLQALHAAHHHIVGITSRPGKWRDLTNRWMVENNVPLAEILMRPDDDYREAPAIKIELAHNRFGTPLNKFVGLLVEDRDDVVSAFMREGVTCLHVRSGIKKT